LEAELIMNESMRRKDRKIDDDQALEILYRGEYGVLSMCTTGGEGYGVPLNYVLWNNNIYFHCAVEGSKLNYIKNNNKVSFCVTGNTEILPSEFGTIYESTVVSGSAFFVEGDEKREALMKLIEKYSADYIREGADYMDKFIDKIHVIKIAINSISGKSRKK